MKVLLLNNFCYRRGGSEAVFFNTADLLRKAGHEVRFFSISRSENELCEDSSLFAPQCYGLSQILAYFYNIRAAQSLEKLVKVWRPDIAHVHLIWGGLSPSVIDVLHRYGVPVVHTVHDYRLVCPAYTFRNSKGEICEKCGRTYWNCVFYRCSKASLAQSIVMALEMRFRNTFHPPVKNIDGFIFVSEFSYNKHIEYNRYFADSRSIVLHNFTAPITHGNSSGYFLFSGRLSREKGCYCLIKAFLQNPGLQLVVAGTGSEEKGLKDLARNCDNIRFAGYLDKAALFKLLAGCSYVVVPSEWYENNPMSIIEAYAASKPVIGARIGGIPEIVVDGETGFLFEAGNSKSLSDILRMCSKDNTQEYKRLCENAKQHYLNNFTESVYFEKLIHFYNAVINEN